MESGLSDILAFCRRASAGDSRAADFLAKALALGGLEPMHPIDRDILRLRYLEGKAPREVAGELGLEEEAVLRRHATSLRKIAQYLENLPGFADLCKELEAPEELPAPTLTVRPVDEVLASLRSSDRYLVHGLDTDPGRAISRRRGSRGRAPPPRSHPESARRCSSR